MAVHYIGADVPSSNTELVVEHPGKIVQRHSAATTIPARRTPVPLGDFWGPMTWGRCPPTPGTFRFGPTA